MPTISATKLDPSGNLKLPATSRQTPLYRATNAIKTTLWLALASCFAIILLEIILSIAQFGEQEYMQIDPYLGVTHLHNKIVTWRAEGFSHGRLNADGFFDRPYVHNKQPNVTRLAVFGDSFTEAVQVPFAQRFTSRLEEKLNTNSAQKFEVMNFGVSGFSTGQEHLLYVDRLGSFQPDIAVVCINQWEPDKNTIWPARPTFSLSPSGHLQVRFIEFDRWRASPGALPFTAFEWARANSRVWGVLLQAYGDMKGDPTYKKICACLDGWTQAWHKARTTGRAGLAEGGVTAPERGDQSAIAAKRLQMCKEAGLSIDSSPSSTKPGTNNVNDLETESGSQPTTSEDRWRITRGLVQQFAAACKYRNCRLVLVVLPVRWQRDALESKFNWLACEGEQQEVPLLNMVPAFAKEQPGKAQPMFLEGHLSQTGHELAAGLIFDFLKEKHILPPAPDKHAQKDTGEPTNG